MVIVACPSCEEHVDLGQVDSIKGPTIYECPHCQTEFEWTVTGDSDRTNHLGVGRASNSKASLLGRVARNQRTGQNDAFPMLIGNHEDPRKKSFFTHVILVCVALFVLPILPFVFIHYLFQQWSFKREYGQNILNPAYLRGTGLMVNSDLSAELITKGKVPRYVFGKEDITCINVHTFHTGLRDIASELRIHLHEFHALTLYGFSADDSRDIVSKLVSLYDVEVYHTREYVDTSDGGGGGG